jgi:hypothetical protein
VDDRLAELERTVPLSGLLGYLNFSDGRPDPRWQKQLNDAYAVFAVRAGDPAWEALLDVMPAGLRRLQAAGSSAFRDVTQAAAAIDLAGRVLTAYREHHRDLLAHLTDAELFAPSFLARVFEAVLTLGPTTADERQVVARLNDFAGHRPIAILETRPQGEPYAHERHRPIPLYLRGAGVAHGRYHDLVKRALEILSDTDPGLLAEAAFDPKLLDEFAVDARAYDHGHPVNRRPNYVFGEWDPHHLDNQGRHRRYVARKITLDGLLARVGQPSPLPHDERLTEASAVLAGTVLMAAGVGGIGPTYHDSATTLSTLIPRIARYRDSFYEKLLDKMPPRLANRLRQEQQTTRQPFGAARQALNAYLARHRALQLQHRHLALLFAEMGYPEASHAEALKIPAVSVRLLSDIVGRLTTAQVEADHGRLADAARRLPEVEDLLRRGIECGAFADPWNALGFQGLFPLSPAREDSVRDQRLDELIGVVELTLELHARLMSETAAAGDRDLVKSVKKGLDDLAVWWDQFATYEVNDVRKVRGAEASSSAAHVATALARWQERGAAVADLAFWKGRLDHFRSPRAFALVIGTLLRKGDYRAAMALLCNWVGRVEQVPLEDAAQFGRLSPSDANATFHTLALRWMLAVTLPDREVPPASDAAIPIPPPGARLAAADRWDLVEKFFAHLEANAEDFWEVPVLEVGKRPDDEEDEEDLFRAAYEDVTYRDSTGGDEGAVIGDGEPDAAFDLEEEGERLEKRLRFVGTVARLWRVAARAVGDVERRRPAVAGWLTSARTNLRRLLALLDAIHAHPLPEPEVDYDSLVEYDRRRGLKEQLLAGTLGACLDTVLAVGALEGLGDASLGEGEASAERLPMPRAGPRPPASRPSEESDEVSAEPTSPTALCPAALERSLFRGDVAGARATLPAFLQRFHLEPLLSPPLTQDGSPRQVLRVRVAQHVLRELLANLPRLGLLRETFDLLRTARAMEQEHPARGRGVTEFNHFFQIAFQEVVETVVRSAQQWPADHTTDEALVKVLERLTKPFLTLWIDHSRLLQLSVLEAVGANQGEWQALQDFVKTYGGDLFHARFMTLANLRGILQRGAAVYLDHLRDNLDPVHPVKLMDDLGRTVKHADAVRRLEIVIQAVVENYEEFKDYNTTTAQSDYGENLHVLLDFLRIKAAYERHSWQFRPLVLAHEVLARRGRGSTAVLWERSLVQLTRDVARQYLDQLARLERERGVRLNTVGDRLNERFVKPLALDRLCALIEPAVREVEEAGGESAAPGRAFTRLQQELEAYTATPTGVGLDVPFWLRRLEMEVHRARAALSATAVLAENFFRAARRQLDYEEVDRQLREFDKPALPG